MDVGFVLVTERKSAALEAIEVEGTRHLLAKPIPRLSDSLGTERERECLCQFPVIQSVEPGPQGGLAQRKQMHKRKGQEGGNAS